MTCIPQEPLSWYGGSYYDTSYDEVEAPLVDPKEDQAETLPDWKWGKRWKKGLVLGRFIPPHRGHEYLVRFAQAQVDKLTLGLRADPQDPIPSRLRESWLKSIFPACRVIGHDQYPKVDVVFSSDVRHQAFADQLGAALVLCDPDRRTVPISASQIRSAPLLYWDFMDPLVRRYYLKVVRVLGPEGSGKTTLCQELASRCKTCYVPEFAQALAAANGGRLPKSALASWARQHLAARQALELQANRILFLDTDLITVAMWGERMYGASPPWIRQRTVDYSATLILEPITQGLTAAQAQERGDFHKLWAEVPGERLCGSAGECLKQALEALERLFGWSADQSTSAAG